MDGVLYERIFESTSDAMFVADAETGEVVAANPAAADLVGRDRSDVVGRHVTAFHPADEREAYAQLFEAFVNADGVTREGLHLETADGTRVPVEYSGSVIEVDGRGLMQASIRDVSDRVELESKLRAERERYRRVFEGSNDAIFVVDPEGDEILDCNERACRLLGYEYDELEGMPISRVHPDEFDQFRAFATDVFDEGSGWTEELTCLRKTGERLPVILAGSTIKWDGDEVMLACVQDISEQRRREQALDSVQRSARRLLEARSREETATVAANAVSEVLETSYGTVWFREDEEFVPVATTDEAAADGLPAADDVDAFLASVLDEMDVDVAERAPPSGVSSALESVLLAPLGDEGVLSVGFTGGMASMEAAKRFVGIIAANETAAIERTDREDELRRATEDLEIINRIVRHDIRNDAALLIGELQQIRDTLAIETDEPLGRGDGTDADGSSLAVAEPLERAAEDAQHVVDVTATVGDLVDVVTDDAALEDECIALRSVLEREVERARSVHETATIRLDAEAEPTVVGTEMLSSVFRNLLNNAVEHHDGDSPTIDVSVTVEDDCAQVRVADDGPGVPEDRKADLFDRGEQGMASTGMGLGLYLVERVTEQFGGTVDVEDADMGGTAFVVALRLAPDDAES